MHPEFDAVADLPFVAMAVAAGHADPYQALDKARADLDLSGVEVDRDNVRRLVDWLRENAPLSPPRPNDTGEVMNQS
jgi:hypothetical protein